VKLEMKNLIGCIEDCDEAIQIDPKYVKSYPRKARALHILTRFQQALDTVKIGLELDPEIQDLKELESQLTEEIDADSLLSKDHPERKKFENLL